MEKSKKIETHYSFTVGEFVFSEFDLKRVEKVDGSGYPIELNDGFAGTASPNGKIRSFPVTIENKRITDAFKLFYDRLYQSPHEKSLNWPEIHKHLVSLFDKACMAEEINESIDHQKEGHECARTFIEKGDQFVAAVLKALDTVENVSVSGIRVLKPR